MVRVRVRLELGLVLGLWFRIGVLDGVVIVEGKGQF